MYYLEKLEQLLTDATPVVKQALADLRKDLERAEAERQKDSYKEYWETVDAIAQEIFEGDRSEEAIHERVDGNYWVIYTHAAHKVWEYSNNEDAVFDLGSLGDVESSGDVLTVMAYYAMYEDVRERLEELKDEEDAAEDEEEDEDAE